MTLFPKKAEQFTHNKENESIESHDCLHLEGTWYFIQNLHSIFYMQRCSEVYCFVFFSKKSDYHILVEHWNPSYIKINVHLTYTHIIIYAYSFSFLTLHQCSLLFALHHSLRNAYILLSPDSICHTKFFHFSFRFDILPFLQSDFKGTTSLSLILFFSSFA